MRAHARSSSARPGHADPAPGRLLEPRPPRQPDQDVTAIGDDFGVPLIRGGEWLRAGDGTWSANQAKRALASGRPGRSPRQQPGRHLQLRFRPEHRLSEDALQPAHVQGGLDGARVEHPALRRRLPPAQLQGDLPKLNDIDALLELDNENLAVKIVDQGYQLVKKGTEGLANPVKRALSKVLPKGPWYWVGRANGDEVVKIYLDYSTTDPKSGVTKDSVLDFDLDSAAKNWLSTLNETSIVVDLAGMKRLFTVQGTFDSQKGKPFGINKPILEVGPDLKPVYDVLVILWQLSHLPDGGYKELWRRASKWR